MMMNKSTVEITINKTTTNNNNNTNSTVNDIFLYDMPDNDRHRLCSILDEQNVWQELALHMGFERKIFQEINTAVQYGSNKSASDVLITLWESQNHSVTELFVLLSRMQQFTAMDSIKNLVDKKYHRLIITNSGQPDLCALLSNQSLLKSNTDKRNLDDAVRKTTNTCKSEKILNGPIEVISRENNESDDTQSKQNKLNSNFGSIDVNNVNEYASTIPKIEYDELLDATNNWNEKNILGKGGFGTVYKGKWKFTSVAIKRIEYRGVGTAEINKVQMQQSLNELRYLNSCRHDNILPLYGYSMNGKEPCLVYQLMTGGSLEQRLARNPSLTWNERLDIAWGTARGLQFLHTFKAKPLIHGDIKPANILLDTCNMPKIGDFGLAREGPNTLNSTMEVSRVYGTRPYLPAEFLGYRTLSTKVDTYSFGVVLFEMATGLKSYDKYRKYAFLTKHVHLTLLNKEASIYDLMYKTNLPTSVEIKFFENMILLGCDCTKENPENRPEMVEVLRRLDGKHII